ncbi:SDR family NAD(P)-dependent oxidoreductase [Serratia ureilytica]
MIVAARDPVIARTRLALAGISNVDIYELDLADLNNIREFAQHLLATGVHLDMVICGAGIMACPETRIGPGWEAQFAINHLGHYALVNHLWPALAGGARVVVISSSGHHASAIRWNDVQFHSGYDKWRAYGQSKTANALFAVHLDKRGRAAGVRAFTLHPGMIPATAALPLAGRDARIGLDRRQRQTRPPGNAENAATGCGNPCGRRHRLNSMALADCIAKTAISPGATMTRAFPSAA